MFPSCPPSNRHYFLLVFFLLPADTDDTGVSTGASKAKELIFTARRLDAARASKLGLVGTVVCAGQAQKEAFLMAGEIAKRGPLAVRAAKLAIDEGLRHVSHFVFCGVGLGE